MDSRDTVLAALARAKDLLKRNHDWDVIHALAEATTSSACGVPSYLVFRDVRIAVSNNIAEPLPDFCETATRATQIAALDRTITELRGT